MYESVRASFINFTTRFEGSVPYMYLDVKGFVTIGIGNLIDPVKLALPLPFIRKTDGSSATQDDITAEWSKVHAMTSLAQQGAGAAAAVTNLMLSPDSITSLVLAKLDSNVATLKATSAFSAFETWPADAQLGVLSMAWALGPSFAAGWPLFAAAAGQGNWSGAAANCQISTAGNPGVAPRNTADVQLFTNAAAVSAAGSDPSVLWYPATPPAAGSGGGTSAGDAGTATAGTTAGGTATDGTTTGDSTGTDGTTTGDSTGTDGTTTGDGGGTDGTATDSGPGGDSADGGTGGDPADGTADQDAGNSSTDSVAADSGVAS